MTADAKQEETPTPTEEAKAASDPAKTDTAQPAQTPPKSETAKAAGKQSDKNQGDDAAKASPWHARLGSILRFVALVSGPLVAIIALVVAGFAVSASRASQAQLKNTSTQLKNLNAALAASKTEIANLKKLVANLGAIQEKNKKNQDALAQQIIQSVNQLQAKAKIKPTLEEQLLQPPPPPAVAPPAASGKAIPPAAATEAPKKSRSQVQALKEAIETFNKNDSKKH